MSIAFFKTGSILYLYTKYAFQICETPINSGGFLGAAVLWQGLLMGLA